MAFKKFLAFFTILSSVYFPIGAQTGIEIPEMSVCDDMVIDFLEEYNIPGASFALTKDGKLVYHRAFGHADISGNEITQPYHLFRIASLSKPITSIAIMKMVEDGDISLSDKVFGSGGLLENHSVIANATINDSRIYDITVQNLLEHSAGWNSSINCFPNPTSPYPWSISGCHPHDAPLHVTEVNGTSNPVSEEDMIVFLLEKGLDFTPNTSYAYSNTGYLVLGEIIEEVSNLTYEDYVKEEILSPLGICDMHLGKNLLTDKQEREVEYTGNGFTTLSCYGTGNTVPWEYGGFSLEAMGAHGGWIASSRDLVRLLVAVDGFASKPDILNPSTISTMTSPSINNSGYAKGWAVNSANNWWHTGSLAGTATIFVRTSGGYTWAVLLNKRVIGSNQFWTDFDNLPWNCVNSISTFPNHDLFGRPATSASDITFSSITNSSVKVSWTNGTGDKRIVVATENPSISSFPLDGKNYFSNNSFSQGDDLGNNTYVVYNDEGSSVEIFNLNPNTQYTFAVFEYNQSTNTGDHKLYKLCGNAEATVSTNEITNIDVIWTGGTGEWNAPSNWDSNVVPDQNSDVHIPPSENDTVFISSNVAVKARTIEIGAGSLLYLENSSSSITIDDGLMDNDGIIINKGVINISRYTYTFDNKNFYGIGRGYLAFVNWGIVENHHLIAIPYSIRGQYLNERGSIFINHESGTLSSDHIWNLGGQFTNSGTIQGSIDNTGYGDWGHDDPEEDSTYIANFLNKGFIKGKGLSSSELSEYSNFGRIELDSSTTTAFWLDDQAYFVNSGSITIGPTIGENAMEIYHPYGGFHNAPGSRLDIRGASNHGIYIKSSGFDTLFFNDIGAEIILDGIDGVGMYITDNGNLNEGKILNRGKVTFGPGIAQNAILSERITKLTNLDAGQIQGTGIIDGSAFKNQGSILPGYSPGVFEIEGDYDHKEAIYEAELAGDSGPGVADGHDQINVVGTATLGGALNVTLINDYTPDVGESFIIMTCTSGCQGKFQTINLPGDPAFWEIAYQVNQVVLTYLNQPPEFTSMPVTTATQDQPYEYIVEASDANNDDLSITASDLPQWLALIDNGDGTANLSGTPSKTNIGIFSITLTVTDANGDDDHQVFEINVINVNDSPVISSKPITEVNQGYLYEYAITASDPDGDVLTITAENLPGWLALTDNGDGTAVLSGTPGNLDVGTIGITLKVTDQSGASVEQTFDINVVNTNDPPSFTSSPVTGASQDKLYEYTINANDPDGDDLTITSDNLPAWLTLTDNGDGSAILTGTPGNSDVGTVAITLTVTDNHGTKVQQSFDIEVVDVNDPPVIISNAVTTANQDELYEYTITSSDPDGDDLTITSANLPGWLSLTDNGDGTASLMGTPGNADVGMVGITLTVTDSHGAKAVQSFDLEVQAVECVPLISSQPIDQSVNEGFDAQFIALSTNSNAVYQWQTEMGASFQDISEGDQYSGTTTSTLTVLSVTQASNNQLFRCLVSLGTCVDTSAVATLTVILVTGINDHHNGNNLAFYPNPVNEGITLKVNLNALGSTYLITDQLGKVIQAGKLKSEITFIDMSTLSTGLYVLGVEGEISQKFKVVKK